MLTRFEYPALVTTRPSSSGKTQRQLVFATGEADIRDVGEDEAPVAAVVSVLHGQTGVRPERFRFFEGRFYRATRARSFDSDSSGLNMHMAIAVCDRFLQDGNPRAAFTPSVAKKYLWSYWRDTKNQSRELRQSQSLAPTLRSSLVRFDPVKFDVDSLSHWSGMAHAYAASTIAVEGRIWKPVDEPMMRHHRSGGPKLWDYEDVSCYRARVGPTSFLLPPYGTRKLGMIERVEDVGPYWSPDWQFLTLPEAAAAADESTGWLCEVVLPEAFDSEMHAVMQLDRAARVVCVALDHSTLLAADAELAAHVRTLRRLTVRRTADDDLDGIETALGGLEAHLGMVLGMEPQESLQSYMRRQLFKRLGAVMGEALERWNGRTISIPEAMPDGTARRPGGNLR